MACADKAHKVDGDGGARACSRAPHAAGTSTLVALMPPSGVGGPSIQTSCLALSSRSTAGSCGRLFKENRPAPSTRGRRLPSRGRRLPDPEMLQRAVEERWREARQAAAGVGKSAEAAKAAGDAAAEQLRVAQAKCKEAAPAGVRGCGRRGDRGRHRSRGAAAEPDVGHLL
eukprot:scaffold35716_cov54-Phaeocystis_antarctica.AAC.1